MSTQAHSNQPISSKLLRALALQLILISLVTALGIFVTNWIVQDLLTEEALRGEAEHFWSLYEADPKVPLPNTQNLTGYLRNEEGVGTVPAALQNLQRGYGRVAELPQTPLVYVSDRNGARLYLVFAVRQVTELAFYYGLLPLGLIMLVIYALALYTYRASINAISPLVRLANHLEAFDYTQSAELDLEKFREAGNSEVNTLIDAVSHFAGRLEQAIERERVFARDAGHELRTPLAVFKGSLDLLEREQERPKYEIEALQRMRRTADKMQSLLQTLLILAREEYPTDVTASCDLRKLVATEAKRLGDLAEMRKVKVSVHQQHQTMVAAPPEMIEIMVNNLLRNAINYSPGGEVDVTIAENEIVVRDSGVGMSLEEQRHLFQAFFRGEGGRKSANGHGLGLAIVKRIVDRYGWKLSVKSAPDEGSEFHVRF